MPAMLPPQQLIEATYGRMMRLPDETQREFAKEKGAKEAGMRKADFEAAMRRQLNDEKIRVESYGPPSRGWSKLVLA